MDEELESLHTQVRSGSALEELRNHQGWAELVNILRSRYTDNVRNLIVSESSEARASIKAIEELADLISLKIDFGKDAAETLKAERFKTMLATP